MRLMSSARPRRRVSLTPMIDVVFLLLVFFMLTARFGQDVVIDLPLGSGTKRPYQGPPRLIDIAPDALRLNGVAMAPDALIRRLDDLTDTPDAAILLRASDGADLQRVVAVLGILGDAGFRAPILVE